MEKRLVLCSAEFKTEEEAIAFGEKLKKLDLTYAVCGNRLTAEYSGEDWLVLIRLFESLPRRSIVANFNEG